MALRTLTEKEVKDQSDAAFKQLYPRTIFSFNLTGPPKDFYSGLEQFHAIVSKRLSETQVEIIILDENLIQNQVKKQVISRNQISSMGLIKNYKTEILFRDYEISAEIYPEINNLIPISLQAPNQSIYRQGKIQVAQQFRVFKRKKNRSLRDSRTGQILPTERFTIEGAADKKVYTLLKSLGWVDKPQDPRFF